jgi:glycerol-1-phosphate dehydrogenase [NAD(P)+]
MQHHTHNGYVPSHGFKVGIGTLASTALYERLLAKPLEKLDVAACCAAWPDLDTWLARARKLFGGDKDFMELVTRELPAKHCSPAQLGEQLELLKAVWPELRERLKAQLMPLATLRQMLHDVGAPTEPEQIGISRERLRQTYWQASCIRRRFMGLDLAIRAGLLDPCLDEIFGPAGPWPIQPPPTDCSVHH